MAKKIIALAMAAILCSANVLPALAEEVPAPAPAASEPAPAPAPASEPAPAAETKTETKTETDKASGEQLTVTTTTTVEEGKKTVTVTWTNEESGSESSGSESEGSGSEGSGSEGGEAPAEPAPEKEYGLTIEGEQTTTEKNGNFTITEVEGEETRTEITEDEGNEPGQPEVNVEIIPGETTTGAASETTVSGDVPTGENDLNYDYTETTEIEREVTVNTSDAEVTVNDADTGLVGEKETELKGLEPVYDADDGLVDGKVKDKDAQGNHAGKEDVFDRNYLSSKSMKKVTLDNGIVVWVNGSNILTNVTVPEGVVLPEDFTYEIGDDVTAWYNKQPKGSKTTGVKINDIDTWYDAEGNLIHAPIEGAEYAYVGTGEHSKFFNAYVYVEYEKDEVTGETLYDENGDPIIKSIKTSSGKDVTTVDGELATELPDEVELIPVFKNYNGSRPTTFMLMDKNGNRVYAYCCDIKTGTSDGFWYSVSNLEDSDYYASEESEEHIRSIVTNGYWGTSDVQKEDGSYETGSLEKIKSDLKDAIINGKMENSLISLPVLDAEGKPVLNEDGSPKTEEKYMMEIIDDLSAGEALLATQSAIWSYANGSLAAGAGKDGIVVIDPDGYSWNHNPSSNSKDGEAMDDWGSARVDFLYNWLIGLESDEESTIIINEKNFVEDVSLTVKDKDMSHADSNDDDKDNDVYNTDLNFKLAFVPGENDDLLVQISYTDLDGNEVNVVRRLAGEAKEGETYGSINPDDDGNYVISGLKLSENEDFDFDLRLEGTQYLEHGVYIYQAVGGRDNSQTFVGVAEGEKNVDVSVGMTVTFDVDEDNKVVAKRKWHKKTTKSNRKPGGNTPGGNIPGNDATVISDDPVPLSGDPAEEALVEILDEEVPLAAAPETGDNSIIFAIMSMLSLLGMAILGKKRVKN